MGHQVWLQEWKGELIIFITGKQMRVTGVVIDRIVDGKAVEGWMEMDTLHQMQQLGLMPWPGKPS